MGDAYNAQRDLKGADMKKVLICAAIFSLSVVAAVHAEQRLILGEFFTSVA